MNILSLTVLINIHFKNYKKDSPKCQKMYRKNTNDYICYLEFILLCSSVTVYHSPNMENLQHLPCYLININRSDNMENIANLSTQPLNSYQNLMVLIYLLFLWRILLIPFTWVWLIVILWVNPSLQFTNSLPFSEYGEFTASATLSDKY